MDRLITFTEVDTTSPAEETVTTVAPEATAPAKDSAVKETEGVAVSPEAMEGNTVSPEAMEGDKVSPEAMEGDKVSPEAMEGVTASPEAEFNSTLTIGAVDGETVVLYAEAEKETSASIGFEPMNFVTNLQYMGTGMLTIFIVIGVIILATSAINKMFSKKKD